MVFFAQDKVDTQEIVVHTTLELVQKIKAEETIPFFF